MSVMTNTNQMFEMIAAQLETDIRPLDGAVPPFILFVSFTDAKSRAVTFCVKATRFKDCWSAVMERAKQELARRKVTLRQLRIDWVDHVDQLSGEELINDLKQTKRNYYRYGISLDRQFRAAFLETELNANAMLYGGTTVEHAAINRGNFLQYMKTRNCGTKLQIYDDDEVYRFTTRAFFIDADEMRVHSLFNKGRDTGRRNLDKLTRQDVVGLINSGANYLATQINRDGRFIYGWHPCFDREILTYNSLRHASTLFSMIDAWQTTGNQSLKEPVERALQYLIDHLIKKVDSNRGTLAFLVDEGDEIKLGGNAVCLLALAKYLELTGESGYLEVMIQLGEGMLAMQDPETGKFNHVLHYPSLEVKAPFRIIYYDGEAAFGLMRLYSINKNPELLKAVEKAFDYFIESKHWKAHDHWLSYATNELTKYRPLHRYYEFGIKNFQDHLDFVIDRITTYPTLLELMMAAEEMVSRMNDPGLIRLLEDVDLEKFHYALESRAHYLLNGYFWPELAMFYANPRRITGSFFIRHHAFRVRIDDVEHYVSGYCAYLHYLNKQELSNRKPTDSFPGSQLEHVS